MSKNFFLETTRLRIRPLTMADFDFFYSMQSDPEMMRFIRPPETDPAVIKSRIETMENYAAENPGLGTFLGVHKPDGSIAALCVLRHLEYQPGNDLEVGYLIARNYWGQGLATELTQALTEYGFGHFGVDLLKAVVDPENLASQKVLLKCGFAPAGKRMIYDSENLEFVCKPSPPHSLFTNFHR
ncbi:MAG: GNAT family N-acetyltransferase [Saprospiraceae bacterium]|nr:GNAT family N-acetyltransferase [Lewinellaceae bacterium]